MNDVIDSHEKLVAEVAFLRELLLVLYPYVDETLGDGELLARLEAEIALCRAACPEDSGQ